MNLENENVKRLLFAALGAAVPVVITYLANIGFDVSIFCQGT